MGTVTPPAMSTITGMSNSTTMIATATHDTKLGEDVRARVQLDPPRPVVEIDERHPPRDAVVDELARRELQAVQLVRVAKM